MNKPVLDWIYRYVDPVLARFGLGKTEFVALVVVVLTYAANSGLIPAEVRDWLVANWQEWLTLSMAAGLLGLRHAVAKATGEAPAPVAPAVKPADPTPAQPLPWWTWLAIGIVAGWRFLPGILEQFAK